MSEKLEEVESSRKGCAVRDEQQPTLELDIDWRLNEFVALHRLTQTLVIGLDKLLRLTERQRVVGVGLLRIAEGTNTICPQQHLFSGGVLQERRERERERERPEYNTQARKPTSNTEAQPAISRRFLRTFSPLLRPAATYRMRIDITMGWCHPQCKYDEHHQHT
jgi:hypothetical protein